MTTAQGLDPSFSFVDLFAGIGGFRTGLTAAGGTCVYTSEWDKFAAHTYRTWYSAEVDTRDIRDVDLGALPDHDLLAAGFPCQPFSLAGVSKKRSLGRSHGFDDERQGNLFFSVLEAIRLKRPKVVLLENVKNLTSHDSGRTFEVVKSSLEELGYDIHWEVVDASAWVPQHRERVFIVGFNTDVAADAATRFRFPHRPATRPMLRDILDLDPPPDKKYMLSDKLWQYLQGYADKHRERGNGFGFGLVDLDGISRTMSARYHKDGAEILIPQPTPGWRNPRRLTPREAARLMGFDDEFAWMFLTGEPFPIAVSDTQAYRQFGNSVVPKVVRAIADEITKATAGMAVHAAA